MNDSTNITFESGRISIPRVLMCNRSIDKLQKIILIIAAKQGSIDRFKIAMMLGKSPAQIRDMIEDLIKKEFIEQTAYTDREFPVKLLIDISTPE
jgi:predicted transcriptional regulator